MTLAPLLLGTALIAGITSVWLGLAAFFPSRKARRRLEAIRLRCNPSTSAKVESQLKKAIAARRPGSGTVGGNSRWRPFFAARIDRSGKNWTVGQVAKVSAGIALATFLGAYLRSGSVLLAIALAVVLGGGLPHLFIGFLIKRRIAAFNARFPDGIELLVRGLRSGFPVAETLSLAAREIPGPVGEEFRTVVEQVRIGRTMEDALHLSADRIGTPEFQFFVITLAIQRETGGNLAETLSNLAEVLRKRAQMKLKVKALSSEARASAYIVGALPFAVFGMIWWVNPDYIGGFFEDPRLLIAGAGGLVWMLVGVLVMGRMVNFEI